jgi:radical SAM superfamily enzyme YgiQ (UPF0313 family)
MKVLLINSNRYKLPSVVPYGLCCVAAAVERSGHQVRFLDLLFAKNCVHSIAQTINEFQPDIIGIGIRNIDNGTGHNTKFLLQDINLNVIQPCKEFFGGPIVIGGAAVGISGEEMLGYFDLSYALRGDGEQNMVEFIHRYENKMPFERIGGLIKRENGKIVENNQPYFVHDINQYYESENIFRFVDLKRYIKMNIAPVPIQTKRGCALNCVYCTYNLIEGKTWRLRSPRSVANEIESLVKSASLNTFEFTDSVFNIPLGHAKEILRAIIAKELVIKLQTMGLNPGAVDEELVDLMKKAGFTHTDLGVESGSAAMIRSLGKHFKKEDIIKAGSLLHEKGIHVNWFLLLGAPGENEDTLQETFDTIDRAASEKDLVTVGVGIRAYKNSPLSKTMLKQHPDCTNDNFLHPLHYSPPALDLDRIFQLVKEHAIKRTNWLIYNNLKGVDNSPYFISRMKDIFVGAVLGIHHTLLPHQPPWHLFTLFRTIARALRHQV